MQKRTKFIAATLLIGLTGAIAIEALRDREPSFNGKKLTAWLEQYAGNMPESSREEARVAICAMGTNALPTLLKLAGHKQVPPTIRRTLGCGSFVWRCAWRLGLSQPYNRYVRSGYVNKPWNDQSLARHGFEVLGPSAGPAVPGLINLVEGDDSKVRLSAARCLRYIGAAAKDAVPILQKHSVSDPDATVRSECTATLANIHLYTLSASARE
ncbi:MAG: hypothetical protein C5B50_15860 [Verrucomicrobia bacterium]|nr:MAG: hypothetical protein C5B50_15860 [Verrucomicrobiota bacterium]